MLYVEPMSAVVPNNELMAARGELKTAEDAVLLTLTGHALDVVEQLRGCYHAVARLDAAAARARYGQWLGGAAGRGGRGRAGCLAARLQAIRRAIRRAGGRMGGREGRGLVQVLCQRRGAQAL